MRIFSIILFTLFLFWVRKIECQTINYQLVDLNIPDEQKLPINILDSLGVFSKPLHYFIDGIHFKNRNQKFSFGNSGFWSTVPVYNFVDGFWVGQTFEGKMEFNKKHRLELETMIYYTTARKKLTWQTDLTYHYLPEMKGKLLLSAGSVSADYDTQEHLARLENSLYSLVAGRNYMKLYQKKFIELKNSFYPFLGFRFFGTLSMQWRNSEVNHTTFSFFKTNIDQKNIPLNAKFRLMPANQALTGTLGFDFTLCKACVYNKNSNEIIYSYIPTISFLLAYGLPSGHKNQSHFQYIEASINQRFKFSKKNTFDYKIGGGTFLFKENLWFPDFKHFGAYSLPSMRTFTEDGYFLIGYYKADTDQRWLKGSANFLSEHFLLTRLKFLDNQQFSEGIHARYLWTPAIHHYTEWGYAFGYRDLARLGFFIGFTGVHYSNFGITISFPWLTGGY